ncbi:MAG: hypothetical protein GXP45_00790 [bacterium]|nr:hypothetical protein [bacterium]
MVSEVWGDQYIVDTNNSPANTNFSAKEKINTISEQVIPGENNGESSAFEQLRTLMLETTPDDEKILSSNSSTSTKTTIASPTVSTSPSYDINESKNIEPVNA